MMFVEQPAKKGRIYTFTASENTDSMTKKCRRAYERLVRLNAPYYLVLRREDEESVMCVPLTEEKIKHGVEIDIDGNKYYAGYLEFVKAMDAWLKLAYARFDDMHPEIEQIYTLRKRHNQYVKHRHKDKRQKKLNNRRLMRELRDGNGATYPKERGSSTVGWKMTHPLQGGRTSPK